MTQIFSAIIIFQIAFGTVFFDAAKAQENSAQKVSYDEVHRAVADAVVEPSLAAMAEDKSFPRELDLNSNDLLLDQDPFFLESQHWEKSTASTTISTTDELVFSHNDQGSQLQLPYQATVWKLQAPLHPIFATSEYIFFAANAGSSIFKAGTTGESDEGQGIFFVAYTELLAASVGQEKVPIYFFPLPGNDWQTTEKTEISITEVPHHDMLIFKNTEGFPLPVNLDDIRSLAKVETINFMLAQSMSMNKALDKLKANSEKLESVRVRFVESLRSFSQAVAQEDQKAFSKSHASLNQRFDQVLLAMKSIIAESDLRLPRGSTAAFGMLFTGYDLTRPNENAFYKIAKQDRLEKWRVAVLRILGINTAQANAELNTVLIGVGIVLAKCAVIFTTGAVLRYTALKQTITERMKTSNSLGTKGWQVHLTVFAQSLTVSAQLPFVWPANSIEYIMDRGGLAENSRVRKIFNATFGYGRKINNRTPVNYKTLLLGGVSGLVDTSLVAVQQYFAIPLLVKGLVIIFPGLASRAAEAWGVGGNMALYNLIAVIYNLQYCLTNSATDYSNQIQDITTNDALRIISAKMREESLNPDDPKNKRLFDDRVKIFVRNELTRQGLPDEKAFLYDANSLYQSIQGFAGYKINGESPGDFYGITRQGLTGRALDRSIERARKEGNEKALDVLLSAKNDFQFLAQFLASPTSFLAPSKIKEVASRYRRVRQELTSFTFVGAPSDRIENLGTWASRGNIKGAKTAAQIFRTEFYELMDVRETEPLEKLSSYEVKNLDPAQTESRFARWQLKRAVTKANEKFVAQTKTDPQQLFDETSDNSALRVQWEKIFRDEVIRASGLYPDSTVTELMGYVEKETEDSHARLLATDADLKAYLDSLSPYNRARVSEIYKADIFVEKYVDATIKEEKVPALSPAQPGVFQRVRQTQMVRKNATANVALRFAEGTFSDTRYKRGFKNLMYRAVPIAEDMVGGNLRELRKTPINGTFRYVYLKAVWASVMPWKRWGIQQIFRGATITGPWATTNRMLSKMGFKPGKSMVSMLTYGFIGSWATFTGGIFYGLFGNDIANKFSQAADLCRVLLTHIKF